MKPPPRRTSIALAGALLLALILSVTISRFGESSEAPPPAVIEKIAAKNRDAAVAAAAIQRAESEVAAEAADRAQDQREEAPAETPLARFDSAPAAPAAVPANVAD